MRPKPDEDGGCFVYTTQTGDTCSSLAAANSLKTSDIDDFNKKTWNFSGCKNLWSDIKICLSKGDPPMPAEVAVSHNRHIVGCYRASTDPCCRMLSAVPSCLGPRNPNQELIWPI